MQHMRKRLATLVGCNYHNSRYELHGCINDVHAMRNVLLNRFGFDPSHIGVLTDAPGSPVMPTGANIKATLSRMVDQAEPGDVLFFHYSGHGTRIPAQKHGSKQDEAIVPCDFNLITDVDFRQLVNRLPEGASFTILSDSCHSGGLIDKEKEQIGPHTTTLASTLRRRTIPFDSILDHLTTISGIASTDVGIHLLEAFGSESSAKFRSFGPDEDASRPLKPDNGILLSGCQATSDHTTTAKMGKGMKKHQKRLSAPSHWLLDKLSGVYAPKTSPGPHKARESLPLIIFLRNRLKYALNYRETKAILKQRLIKVDGKVRTDMTYPTGFMDVVGIEKTGENFRLVYDTKGRFTVHRIQAEEAEYKLGKVRRVQLGRGGIPFLVTHDARTIRYPDPLIKVNDTVKIDLATGKITDFIKFDTGALAMVTGGRNMGRVGVITHRERHDGGFNIVHLKDAIDNTFATRESNVFVIGQEKPWISLPKGRGVKLTIAEERDRRRAHALAH